MARIPIPQYQQRQRTPLDTPMARAPMVAVEDQTGRALQGAARDIGQVSDSWLRVQDEEGRAGASRLASTAQAEWMQTLEERKNTAQPGAAGFVESLRTDFAKYREEAIDAVPAHARKFYEARLDDIGNYLTNNAISFQSREQIAHTQDQYRQGAVADAQSIQRDPTQYVPLMAARRATLGASELPPSMRTQLLRDAERDLSLAAESAQLTRDPGGYIRARGGDQSADAVVNSTIDRFEGTTLVARDGNSGAPAKFGINKRANPDVDVENLTREQAVQIYKDRYWTPIGADGLPPQLAAVAFDTAVNMGVGPAKAMLEQSGGDPARLLELRRERYRKIVSSDPSQSVNLKGWMNRVDALEKDLGATPQHMEMPSRVGNPSFDALSWEDQQRLVSKAGVLFRQNQAIAREQLQSTVADASASYLATGRWDGPQVTRSQFIQAFGPEEGFQRWGSFENVRQTGADIQAVTGMSSVEQDALLVARRPVSGPGFADEQRRYGNLESAVASVRRQRQTDPAYSSIQSSESVKASYVAMSTAAQVNDPEGLRGASNAYAVQTIAEQRRLGVMEPKILSASDLQNVTGQLQRVREGSEDTANQIMQLEQQWGQHWPTVFGQLAGSGALSDAALVIPNVVNPGVRERIARTSQVDEKALKTRLPEGGVKDIERSLSDEMESAWTAFSYQGGGAHNYQVIYDTARKLAMSYAAGGTDPKKAAKQAYDEILGQKYEFGSTYRVPRSEIPGEVMSGAERVVAELDPASLAIPVSLRNLPPAAARSGYHDVVKNNSFFVTNNDETGLDLYVLGEDGMSPVLSTDGAPVSFSWASLRGTIPRNASEAYIGFRRPGKAQ